MDFENSKTAAAAAAVRPPGEENLGPDFKHKTGRRGGQKENKQALLFADRRLELTKFAGGWLRAALERRRVCSHLPPSQPLARPAHRQARSNGRGRLIRCQRRAEMDRYGFCWSFFSSSGFCVGGGGGGAHLTMTTNKQRLRAAAASWFVCIYNTASPP